MGIDLNPSFSDLQAPALGLLECIIIVKPAFDTVFAGQSDACSNLMRLFLCLKVEPEGFGIFLNESG